ncbi:MAG: HypC/HybG/HupF family hydrogenase formation chaperone [Gemmatimonadota bacterium]|jgi:hydrogenase expression/formation protein HypC
MCLGIPGRIVEINDVAGLPMGVVDFGGVRREVCLAYVADEVSVGDYAVVHVGFAISKVDEEEARRTYDILREMGELNDLQWVRDAADAAAAVEAPPSAAAADDAGRRAEGAS